MLSKFISMSEIHFQNTETALKNLQASIQRLETQIGQLSKLISKRPQDSLPSNTESNPREQLNAINIQDEEGVVEPEPEPRQETVASKGQCEVDNNKNKTVNVEYKPRVPYPNATRKDRSDEQFANKRKLDEALHMELNAVCSAILQNKLPNIVVEPEPEPRQETVASKGQCEELTLREGDETITLQARNSGNTSGIEGGRLTHSPRTDNMVQPTLQEMSLKEAHESILSNSRGPIHEGRRLQIEELDEWQMHKPRTPYKPNL
ncbi:hypothetical protein GOBAR_AA10250 [Gossypium barbadense]|uniref:Uncharacterized protein n=1 Tax=Gossypium barbadense TaxID=3634 RepID=A0A2P5Y459_GOSBA|nr:hypothetical protein GOBAR_AA10250 [Gossypium barbadense]